VLLLEQTISNFRLLCHTVGAVGPVGLCARVSRVAVPMTKNMISETSNGFPTTPFASFQNRTMNQGFRIDIPCSFRFGHQGEVLRWNFFFSFHARHRFYWCPPGVLRTALLGIRKQLKRVDCASWRSQRLCLHSLRSTAAWAWSLHAH
jgi:hypothetical protein